MNIPAQDHGNVVSGVASVVRRLTNALGAQRGEQERGPPAMTDGVISHVPESDSAAREIPVARLRERSASPQETMRRKQSGAQAHRRRAGTRFGRARRLTAALAGYVPWSGRRLQGATFDPAAADLLPLLNLMPGAVIVVDDDFRVVLANEPAVTLFGHTASELSDMSFVQLFPRMPEDSAGERSGRSEPGAPDDGRAASCGQRMAIARSKDGSEHTVSVKCTRYGPDGASAWIVMIADPCSQAAARRDDQQRVHFSRVSELGDMAAALAHEINQPLTAILSNARAAQRFLESTPQDQVDLREALADIVADSCRATEIVRKLRQFVGEAPPETQPLDMGNLAREVAHLMRRDALARGVHLTLDIAGQVPLVHCDNIQLQQVLINLLRNAFDAVEGCRAEDRVVSVKVSAAPQGKGVSITVSDRGPGLNTDQIGEIFKPFFTSKPHGMGLGLSISRMIVTRHGGHLWAESNSDRGATFHLLLPSASAAAVSELRQS
ncbi:two-component system sensor kinase FixL [Paraburkholderia sp. GAS448]